MNTNITAHESNIKLWFKALEEANGNVTNHSSFHIPSYWSYDEYIFSKFSLACILLWTLHQNIMVWISKAFTKKKKLYIFGKSSQGVGGGGKPNPKVFPDILNCLNHLIRNCWGEHLAPMIRNKLMLDWLKYITKITTNVP